MMLGISAKLGEGVYSLPLFSLVFIILLAQQGSEPIFLRNSEAALPLSQQSCRAQKSRQFFFRSGSKSWRFRFETHPELNVTKKMDEKKEAAAERKLFSKCHFQKKKNFSEKFLFFVTLILTEKTPLRKKMKN